MTEWSENLGRIVDESKTHLQNQVESLSVREGDDRTSRRKDQAKAPASEEDADSINTMSREELMNVNGIGPLLADKIISSRPYSSRQELVQRGILPQSTFEDLEREIKNRHKRSA